LVLNTASKVSSVVSVVEASGKTPALLTRMSIRPVTDPACRASCRAPSADDRSPLLIPGLLQTPAYARAVCRAYQPTAREESIEELVAARMERTRLLDDPTDLLLWAVVDEAALRRVTGGREVMAEALRHIAGLGRRGRAIVLTDKLPPESLPPEPPRHPFRLLECAECGIPGRPEALPGGLCGACRDERAPARPKAPLSVPAVSARAAGIRSEMSLRRRERTPA
jgi:hypothetical protein